MIDVCDFQLIGELKDDPHRLLLLGNDGACYAFDTIDGEIAPLEPDDSWAVDIAQAAVPRQEAPVERKAS